MVICPRLPTKGRLAEREARQTDAVVPVRWMRHPGLRVAGASLSPQLCGRQSREAGPAALAPGCLAAPSLLEISEAPDSGTSGV